MHLLYFYCLLEALSSWAVSWIMLELLSGWRALFIIQLLDQCRGCWCQATGPFWFLTLWLEGGDNLECRVVVGQFNLWGIQLHLFSCRSWFWRRFSLQSFDRTHDNWKEFSGWSCLLVLEIDSFYRCILRLICIFGYFLDFVSLSLYPKYLRKPRWSHTKWHMGILKTLSMTSRSSICGGVAHEFKLGVSLLFGTRLGQWAR